MCFCYFFLCDHSSSILPLCFNSSFSCFPWQQPCSCCCYKLPGLLWWGRVSKYHNFHSSFTFCFKCICQRYTTFSGPWGMLLSKYCTGGRHPFLSLSMSVLSFSFLLATSNAGRSFRQHVDKSCFRDYCCILCRLRYDYCLNIECFSSWLLSPLKLLSSIALPSDLTHLGTACVRACMRVCVHTLHSLVLVEYFCCGGCVTISSFYFPFLIQALFSFSDCRFIWVWVVPWEFAPCLCGIVPAFQYYFVSQGSPMCATVHSAKHGVAFRWESTTVVFLLQSFRRSGSQQENKKMAC